MSLRDLFQRYHDEVQFLMIYIREAHPCDGWWLGSGLPGLVLRLLRSKALTDIEDPKSLPERRAVASQCEATLQYGVRTYVDEMDDRVSRAYAAKPTRLYLIGLDGRVVYAGGRGPFGFKPAELGQAIEQYLATLEQEESP